MLFLYRKNLLVNSLLLIPYILLLRLPLLFKEQTVHDTACPSLVFDSINSVLSSPLLHVIFTSLLLFFQGLMINRIVIINRITREFTVIPGLIYILIASLLWSQLSMTPLLLANTFLILCFRSLFTLTKHPRPYIPLAMAGFYTGLASLLYFPYVLMIPLAILTINSLRSIELRSYFQFLLSMTSVFIIVFSTLFFKNLAHAFFVEEWLANASLSFDFSSWVKTDWILFAAALFILLLPSFQFSSFIKKKSLAARKKISLLFLWQSLCFIGLLFICKIEPQLITVIAWPFSILFCLSYLKSKNSIVHELIHIVCLVLVLNNHYGFFPIDLQNLL